MAEQTVQGAMAEQAAQEAMAGRPLWPWPHPSAWPLWPETFTPQKKKIHGGITVSEARYWSLLGARLENRSPFWARLGI